MIVETQGIDEMKTEEVHEEKEMTLEIPMGKKEEKTGMEMESEQQARTYAEGEMSDRELLESINGKLDIVLATQKTNVEV